MAKEIGAAFKTYGALKPQRARVGVVYDPLCEDFQRMYTEAYGVDQQIYLASLYGAYKMLFDRNIPCDMIRMQDIEQYDTVILSNKLVLTEAEAEQLKRYLHSGGHCIVDGKFGIVDETSKVYSVLPGGYANALTGLDLLDTDYEGLRFDGGCGYYCRELCNVQDAQVLAQFDDGVCAVAQKRSGKGTFTTLNTFAFYGYAKDSTDGCGAWVEKLLNEQGIESVCNNRELKIKFASSESKQVAIAFNYTDAVQNGKVLCGGKTHEITLQPHDAQIINLC